MPAAKDMPSTLRRSGSKAQRTWAKAHDSAVEQYGEGERSHRTAFDALKHTHEKSGDRWVPKSGGRKGPSDTQAAKRGAAARRPGRTAGGVDVLGRTKDDLLAQARRLGIRGRSRMTKDELGQAINKANQRATAKARSEPPRTVGSWGALSATTADSFTRWPLRSACSGGRRPRGTPRRGAA